MVQLEALIGSLIITLAEAVEDYQGDYTIAKVNLVNPSASFLDFAYNGVMLPAVLNSQDSNNFYYTIRIPFLAVGDNEILIYSANSDNSNKELTFHEYYNFKNGFPSGWQSGYSNGTISSASTFNSIAWYPAGSRPTVDGWIKDANTDYIRHQSKDGFLITNDLTTNQEAEGYTYEFIAEFAKSTYWSFGFGARNNINSDNVRTSDANGSVLNLQNDTSYVTQSIPVVAGVMYKIKIAISIYADRVNYKGWSSDNVLLFDRTVTRALSSTNNDSRSHIKFWGGSQESRFYEMLKRKNAISSTYSVSVLVNPITNLSRTGTLPLVNLTWTGSSGATGYNIYLNGTLHGNSNTTSYNLTLQDKGKFTVTVKAYNAVGESDGVDLVDAWVTLPEKPRVKVNTLTHNTISITSTIPEDLVGYELVSSGYHNICIFGNCAGYSSVTSKTHSVSNLSSGLSGTITCIYKVQDPVTKVVTEIIQSFILKTQDLYHYQISAQNDVGEGPSVTSGTCIGLKYPTFVSDIKQVHFDSTTPSATIRWSRGVGGNGVDIVAYIIHVYETGQQYRIEGDITEGLITGAVVSGNTYKIKIETRCVVNGTEVSAAMSPEVSVNIEEVYLAQDNDFVKVSNRWIYRGSELEIEIPHIIQGGEITSYDYMFYGTGTYLATPVTRVVSNNKRVTSMTYMFYNSSATTLDLSSFNTSNVTDMSSMFFNSKATTLDLSSFDTSNVTNMRYMFNGSSATTLDLSSFDTSNVTNMTYMFRNSSATTLDLSSFDTSKVTSMSNMFYNSKATTLDLSSFDTSNVTDMSSMFYNSSATTLDLSSFDTSNVTNMKSMFYNSSATTLDLSSFNTSNVTDMSYMFNGYSATTLDLSSFDTSNVTNMRYMFNGSSATTGYARTQADADRFNASSNKPSGLTFIVKLRSINTTISNTESPQTINTGYAGWNTCLMDFSDLSNGNYLGEYVFTPLKNLDGTDNDRYEIRMDVT